MPQLEPSVSDSISYLQNFINTSASVLDGQGTGGASLSESSLPPPPPSLPALFLDSSWQGRRHASSFPVQSSPPSTISVLSHRSSAQRSTVDDAVSNSAFVSPQFPQPSHRPSLPTRAEWRQPHPASSAVHHTSDSSVNGLTPLASNAPATASVAETSSMFRYGSDSARRTGDQWRNSRHPPTTTTTTTPLTRSAGLMHRGEASTAGVGRGGIGWQRASPLWSESPSPQQPPPPRQRLFTSSSPSSLEQRGSLRAEERFPWRHSTVAPPTHQGSSLLWGWGSINNSNNGSGGGAAAALSPSPYQPTLCLGEDHLRSSGSGGGGYHTGAPPVRLSADTPQPREAAYEEVEERKTPAMQRRRPPLPPPSTTAAPLPPPTQPQSGRTLELSVCHNPDEHAANMRRIAHYLKDYYAREADEMERGVESLTAEDVAGLAQCFYIDLYRTVRQARRSAGLETSSFVAEDPTENVVAPIVPARAPPPPVPPQKEGRRFARHSGRPTAPPPPSRNAEEVASSDIVDVGERTGDEGEDERRQRQHQASPARGSSTRTAPQRNVPEKTSDALVASSRLSNSGYSSASSGRQQEQQQLRGASPPSHSFSHPQNPLLLSPEDELLSSPAATMRLAPNGQLAYSGGGTHPVQVITARVPAFRNDDTVMVTDGTNHTLSLRQQEHLQQQQRTLPPQSSSFSPSGVSGFHHPSPSVTYDHNGKRSGSLQDVEAASLSALARTPSPPYRHLASVPPQPQPFAGQPQNVLHRPWSASTSTSPYSSVTHPANSRRPGTTPGIMHDSVRHSPRRAKHRRRSGERRAQLRPRPPDVSSSNSSSDDDGVVEDTVTSYTAEASDRESSVSSRGRPRHPVPSEPSSGIVKRPLKELMPLLRAHGTVLVKHVRHDRRPHLRLFQILDCIDLYQGKEVLMPHFTWVAANDVYRHDRRPRPKKTKGGVPLPTGLSLAQQEVPYETALNLTHLEAVYVGAGRGISAEYMGLFQRRRRDSVVVDHRRRPVANGMCAVFVFAERPVAVTFLREDDRQLWVGAMMGVVERNRTLGS
jgi:hypothetical protein